MGKAYIWVQVNCLIIARTILLHDESLMICESHNGLSLMPINDLSIPLCKWAWCFWTKIGEYLDAPKLSLISSLSAPNVDSNCLGRPAIRKHGQLRKSYSGKIYLSNVFEGQIWELILDINALWKLAELCWRSFCWDLFCLDGTAIVQFPLSWWVGLLNIDSLRNASFVLLCFFLRNFKILIVREQVCVLKALLVKLWHKLVQERF